MHLYKVENKERHIWELFSVLAILNVLDIIFTKISFVLGSTETNPLMIPLYLKFGFAGLIMPKVIAILFVFLIIKYFKEKYRYTFMRNVLYVCIVPYLGLTVYHIFNICMGIGIL